MTRLNSILTLLALAGCLEEDTLPLTFVADCSATVDEDVATRVRVHSTSERPGPSWVEFDIGDTPVVDDESTEHEAVLLGLPQLTEATWRAITDGETVCEGTVTTGPLPITAPELTVTLYDPERASPEPWILGAVMQSEGTVYILNRAGEIVWFHTAEEGSVLFDVEVLPGGSVAWNVADQDLEQDESFVVEAQLAGHDAVHWPTALGHHAFAATPTGFAYLMLDIRPWFDPATQETYDVAGDAVVLVDRKGTTTTLWSTWDSFAVASHDHWMESLYDGIADWTHGNALFWSEERGTLLYSSPILRTLVEISTSGSIQTFGPQGTYQVLDADDAFANQHGATWTDSGTLLMFMTRLTRSGGSGAIEYEIDEAMRTFHPIWSYGFDLGLTTTSLGGAQRLHNGNTLVNFGASGLVQEVTPDGVVVWELVSDLGTLFGDQVMMHDLYGSPPED